MGSTRPLKMFFAGLRWCCWRTWARHFLAKPDLAAVLRKGTFIPTMHLHTGIHPLSTPVGDYWNLALRDLYSLAIE